MRKSLKESLRCNNVKKIGKSCFKVKNYFHISLSHLSYNIKIYFSEHVLIIILIRRMDAYLGITIKINI